MKEISSQLNYRLGVASRAFAGIVGGYAVATMSTLAFTYILSEDRAQGLLAGMMLSFLIYAAAILWVFAAQSARHAWFGIISSFVFFGVLYLFVRPESLT